MANPSVVPGKQAGELFIPAIGKTIKLVEWREDDFYDTVQVPNGAVTAGATYEFFRDLSNKNLQHTNLRTARRIPAGSEFIMSRIGLLPCQAAGSDIIAVDDITQIAYAACLIFKLNDRLVSEGPVVKYASGLGVAGAISTTAATTTKGLATLGVPSAAAAPNLLVSQPVGDDDDLQATLEFRGAAWFTGYQAPTIANTHGVPVSLMLHGYIKKPSSR